MEEKLLAQITIPKFITEVCLSKSARPKYYTKKSKKIPKTYLQKYSFNKNGYLVDNNGKRILANPKKANKARYEVLSGNKLMSGYGSPHIRAKLVKELKNFYRPFIQEYLLNNKIHLMYPLRVEWEVYTTVEEDPNWDASNLHFYYKYFEDALHEKTDPDKKEPLYKGKPLLQMIPDDNIKYIIKPPGPEIIPIDDWNKRKFVFKFYQHERPELKRKPWV